MKSQLKTSVILIFLIQLLASCWVINPRFVKEPKKDAKPIKVSEEYQALGKYNSLRACYDVLHYAIEIEPNPETKTIKGTVIFTCRLDSISDSLQFDLHKNLDVKGIYVKDDIEPISFTRKYRAIQFSIADYGISKGDIFQFRVEYGGKAMKAKRPPWKGGTVWKKDKNKNPWLGVACETQGASVWIPCKDHNLDEADSVSVSIICRNTVTGVSNGVLTGVDTLENEKLKFNWATSYPINNYNITYYVGDFVEIKDTLNAIRGLVNVSHYVLRDNEQIATDHFQQVHDIFHFYEKTFGPYSWVKDGFKLVEAPYAGMEHQTAIAYGSDYKNKAIVHSDYIILHEVAHEWWGNSISATDFAHIWIHEGMATYSEALYAEHVGGADRYFNKIRYDKIFIQNKRPVVGPEDLMYFNFKESDCYMKGSVVMATLRSVLESDSLFFEIIKTFYAENEKQLVNTTDFMDLVNSITGQNFNWFFNQYLYDRHVPTLEQFVSFDGFIYHRWSNCNPDFKMELDVEINNIKYHIKPTTVLSRTEIHKTGIEHNYSFDNYAKYYRWNKENHELEKEYEDAASETLDH
tara:strand:- start:46913 stop:48643 length:1731 start_codon:yes stop_codon:yes gene_type:complete